jgi:hypothetical protein
MTREKHDEPCPICGAKLDLLQNTERLACAYCGMSGQGKVFCSEGHSICDRCRSRDAWKMIEETAFTTEIKDPLAIAELMMGHPNLPMLGCEHVPIAAGAFMAALKNSPYGKGRITNTAIREAFDRAAKQTADDSCGRSGMCGIAPAIGACFSLFLGAQRGSDTEQRITMEAVVKVSQAIAGLTGPSCCKAYVRAALASAVTVFAERFGIILPSKDGGILCRHGVKHPHGCREEKCPYFQQPTRDIFAEAGFVPGIACTI